MAKATRARLTHRQFLKWCGLATLGAGAAGASQLVARPKTAFADYTVTGTLFVQNVGGESAVRLTGDVGQQQSIYFTDGSANFAWYKPGGTNLLRLWSAGTGDLLTVLNTGNVGIGVSMPTSKLHVLDDFNSTGITIQSNGQNGADKMAFAVIDGRGTYGRGTLVIKGSHNTFDGSQVADGASMLQLVGASQSPNPHTYVFTVHPGANLLKLDVANNGAGGTVNGVMVWKNNGNVGVGTINPQSKLDVSGAVAINGNIAIDSSGVASAAKQAYYAA